MDVSGILLGVVPLLVFVIVDSLANAKKAIFFALLVGFLELGFTLYKFGTIDSVTVIMFGLLLLMGGLSLKKDDPVYFYLQPAILSLFLSIVLIGSYLYEKPLFREMIIKYADVIPENKRELLTSAFFLRTANYVTLYFGVALIFHAAVTAYFGLKQKKWAWIIMRGIVFYLLLFICNVLAQFKAAGKF